LNHLLRIEAEKLDASVHYGKDLSDDYGVVHFSSRV